MIETIITIYSITDDLLKIIEKAGIRIRLRGPRPEVEDSIVISVAVLAFINFHGNYQLAYDAAKDYFSHLPEYSRFIRRVIFLSWLVPIFIRIFSKVFRGDEVIIDSIPVPVCKPARSRRNKKVQGRQYLGYSKTKGHYLGFKLHLVLSCEHIPVGYTITPASYHDLQGLMGISDELPCGVTIFGDKAYNDALVEEILREEGKFLICTRRKNQRRQFSRFVKMLLRRIRSKIEGAWSVFVVRFGIGMIKAVSFKGFIAKVLLSILAYAIYTMMKTSS
jgi:hypothetical protein